MAYNCELFYQDGSASWCGTIEVTVVHANRTPAIPDLFWTSELFASSGAMTFRLPFHYCMTINTSATLTLLDLPSHSYLDVLVSGPDFVGYFDLLKIHISSARGLANTDHFHMLLLNYHDLAVLYLSTFVITLIDSLLWCFCPLYNSKKSTNLEDEGQTRQTVSLIRES